MVGVAATLCLSEVSMKKKKRKEMWGGGERLSI